LRTLEADIYRVARAEARQETNGGARTRALRAIDAMEASIQGSLERLRETLATAHRSSYRILYALIVLFVLNALYLAVFALFPHVSHYLLIGGNLVAITLAILVWRFHDLDLQHHLAALHFHIAVHPSPKTDSPRP
jgi:hypothetical protein